MRFAAALLFVLTTSILTACGDDELSGEDVAERVADAVTEEGMVYHAVADDGAEVWIDATNEQFRRLDLQQGGATLTRVGEGWTRIEYDPLNNRVEETDENPEGDLRPRIDHPMITWLEPLSALAFGREFNVIGETSADGKRVLAVEARTPITQDGQPTGRILIGRVEVDPETYLPHAFERREDVPPGATPANERIRVVYTTSELIPRADLPGDFFDRSAVEDQVRTVEQELDVLRQLGITPYWLGQDYFSDRGSLSLPPEAAVTSEPASDQAELHYALLVGTSEADLTPILDSVIVRLGPADAEFGPPSLPELAGSPPEDPQEVEALGGPAQLFTSLLTPAEIGACGDEECPPTSVLAFRRLLFKIGDTTVQIEAFARLNTDGSDLNPFNSADGILELAEALQEPPTE